MEVIVKQAALGSMKSESGLIYLIYIHSLQCEINFRVYGQQIWY